MKRFVRLSKPTVSLAAALCSFVCCGLPGLAGVANADEPAAKALPAAASRAIDFHKDVLPILSRRCASCHAGGKQEGGLSMSSRESLLKGGDSGAVVVSGDSAKSLLIQLVAGVESERIMPAKGQPLSAAEVGLLRTWIDKGIAWEKGIRLDGVGAAQAPLEPRRPELPVAADASVGNPIDRLLQPYFQTHTVTMGEPVSDRLFARRVYLDLLGLLPPVEVLHEFEQDKAADKRARLIRRLLEDRENYALHWLTFWNDALRNDYRGTGFIDNGRSQITGWLFEAIYDNKPYDQMVRELIAPVSGSEGFTKGIYWRGVVNASQRREMQAAQTIAQVLLGTNLKCASCHDSFINHWKLMDAYGLAAVFADEPLAVHHCDKPTGETARAAFIFPELGAVNPDGKPRERAEQLAQVVTSPKNGRLARTVVNRLWERFFGRGIVATVDDMDQPPFDADLLDWLAADLQDHGYDLARTLELICTSRAYQSPAVGTQQPVARDASFVFQGPLVRRVSAEQFVDAVSTLSGEWSAETPEMVKVDGRGQGGQLVEVSNVLVRKRPADDQKFALPFVEGRNGKAIELDGRRQTVRVPHDSALKPAREITICAWIKPRKALDAWQEIYRKEDGAGRSLLAVGGARETFGLWVGLGIGGEYREIGAPLDRAKISDGKWHFVAATYDGAMVRLFADGRELHAEAVTGALDTSGANDAFLGSHSDKAEFFGGALDDVCVFDRALAAKELGTLAEGGQPAAGPIARWKLDGDLVDSVTGKAGKPSGVTTLTRPKFMRAALTDNSPLLTSLGRPNREQVVTVRDSIATTLQALELTNGSELDAHLQSGAKRWLARSLPPRDLIREVYLTALGRAPTVDEAGIAERLVGSPANEEGVQDLLWAILMLPEFQLIY